jgi:hypothetical protein
MLTSIPYGINKIVKIGDFGTPRSTNDKYICVVHGIVQGNKRGENVLKLLQFQIDEPSLNVDTVNLIDCSTEKWWVPQSKHRDLILKAYHTYESYKKLEHDISSNGVPYSSLKSLMVRIIII